MSKKTKAHLAVVPAPAQTEAEDHFVVRDGVQFAGQHLIIDLWGCTHLDDMKIVQAALLDSVKAIGATLLNIDLHHFEPNGGISGVCVLAESHISIHTWPERGYAALDVFVCGTCEPHKSVPVLRRAFHPENVQVTEIKRGLIV